MVALTGRRTVWLTGATSGIGHALATRLLDEGHNVALSARSHDALARLAGNRRNALLLPLDVSDREAVRAAGIHLDSLFGRLDLAIFNAGTCEYVDVRRFDLDLVQRVFSPNFFGVLHCLDAALPLLRKARSEGSRPLIAATSSASAYVPLPRAAAYGASKAALSHFLESLRLDLHSEGIDISLIHPGFVDTPLSARNDFPMPMRISASAAAEAILKGLEHRRLDIHFPRRFTLGARLMGILPPTLRHRLGLHLVRPTPSEPCS